MYNPAHFEETRTDVLHGLIATHPLGALVTLTSQGLDANHIPFELAADAGPLGTLRGHVARANPVWKNFSATVDALVIFQGPSAYITPTWYESKKEHGKVVPTYNYCVVHAHGPLRVIDDPVWLRAMVDRLTQRFEAGRPSRATSSRNNWPPSLASRSRSRASRANGRSARIAPSLIAPAWSVA
jgi:transcriptional regulator